MLLFRVIGNWGEQALRVSRAPGSRLMLPEVDAAIESAWQTAKQRKDVQLFDGPMLRLERFSSSPDELHLYVSETSYRLFLGTNMSNARLADQHSERILANPIGLSTSLESSDGYLLLGRRNEKVAYYPGRIHPFAGAAEPNDPLNLFDEVRRELKEELGFTSTDIADLRCVALAEDRSLRQPELIFQCRSNRSRDDIAAGLDKTEHRGVWSEPSEAEAISDALRHPELFTPIAVATLLLFGLSRFGQSWFDQHAAPFV